METGDLTDTLEVAGLSPYQAEAYVTLLELGSASAGELADASDVPRPRIYDVLRDLEDAGYVVTFEQDRLYARARPPDELRPLRDRIQRFEAALEEIERRYHTPATRDSDVTLVTRFDTVFQQARRDLEAAERHVQAVLQPDQFESLRADLAAAYEDGVVVQVALCAPEDDALPDPERFEGVCTEVRRIDLMRPFLVVTDRQRVSFSPKGRSPEEYGVLVDARTTAFVFHWFFLTACWGVYEPLHAEPRDEPPYTFVEITEAVRHLEELVHEDLTVHVRIEGYNVMTGRRRTLTGTVADVDYVGHTGDGDERPSIQQLAARATLVVETDDGLLTVGGDGAMDEDVSAERIVVERVEER